MAYVIKLFTSVTVARSKELWPRAFFMSTSTPFERKHSSTLFSPDATGMEKEGSGDPFQKPKVASVVGRYTPLHWASYKGHYKVVWLLLKEVNRLSSL